MKSSSLFAQSAWRSLVFILVLLLLWTGINAQRTLKTTSQRTSVRPVAEAEKASSAPSTTSTPGTLLDGNALVLNGASSYVRVFSNPSLNVQAPLSLELWLSMDNWAEGGPAKTGIVSKSEHGTGGYEFGLDQSFSSRTVGFSIGGCGLVEVGRGSLAPGWHHFIGTYDGRFIRLYVDGQLRSTFDVGQTCAPFYPYSAELRFGRSMYNQDYGYNLFKGQLDEVRLYSKLLAPQDAIVRFNAGQGIRLPDAEPGLVAGWHFDEFQSTVASSYSGTAFNGYIQNRANFIPRVIPPNTAVGMEVTNISTSAATVKWQTLAVSDSRVKFGPTPDLGSTVSSPNPTTGHAVELTNLLPYTTYYYRVESRTADGQVSESKLDSFQTMDVPPTDQNFYASPIGSSLGNGSYGSPWDLQTALSSPAAVQPGATIWLRGGTYLVPIFEGGFISSLSGTREAPIKVRSAPREWAVIDGNLSLVPIKNRTILTINGSNTWFMDLEITNSDPAGRKIPISGSNPVERRGNSIDDYSSGSKLINLVIHDTGQGIGAWQQGSDNEYYGNIIYNNGWDAPDRTHGHGVYTQNAVGYKWFVDNVIFNPFSGTTRTGGTDDAAVRNYKWQGNVFFNGSMAWLGPHIENLKVIQNYTYNNDFKVGNEINSTYVSAEVRDNYFMSGVQLFDFSNGLVFQNNTVWNNDPVGKNVVVQTNSSNPRTIYDLQNNTYHRNTPDWPYWQFKVNGAGAQSGDYAFNRLTGTQAQTYQYTQRSWQDHLLFDTNSTYVDTAPSGQKVFLRRNQYDPHRTLVIIYNWSGGDFVDVNLGPALKVGDKYELRNVQDYFGDVIEGTFRGVSIRVQMTGRSRAKPVGYDNVTEWYHDPLQPNTFPKFGVFVLRKKERLAP